MGNLLKTAAIVILSFTMFLPAEAQSRYKWMIGVNTGTMIYQGDLTPSTFGSYKTPSLTFGVSAAKILNPYFAVRANAVFGKLKGDDAVYKNPVWRQYRAFNFTSSVTEFNAQLLWSPYGNNSHETGQRITPYLFGGAGVSFVNISRFYSRLDSASFGFSAKQQNGLRIDSARNLPRKLFVLPLGAGLSYHLSSRWSLNYELTFRYTFTDYLDGFSYSVNPGSKDYYHSHTLGLVYRFGGNAGEDTKLGCPVIKY